MGEENQKPFQQKRVENKRNWIKFCFWVYSILFNWTYYIILHKVLFLSLKEIFFFFAFLYLQPNTGLCCVCWISLMIEKNYIKFWRLKMSLHVSISNHRLNNIKLVLSFWEFHRITRCIYQNIDMHNDRGVHSLMPIIPF